MDPLVITKRGKWRVFEDVRAALTSERHRAIPRGGVWASEEPRIVRRS